jgi:hypothetical protein
MFTLISSAVLALAASAAASPVARLPRSSSISSGGHGLSGFSFNGWGGFSSLNGFDDFYGSDNFCGNNNVQTVLSQTVVCHTEEIVVIQQQLAILQEFAKRIVVEQICEVETQTIVWSQFVGSFSSFGDDLRHVSGRTIGYDHSIASHISGLVDSSNDIISSNFGFRGLDIGGNLIHASGGNWVSGSSEVSVQQALLAAQVAQVSSSSTFASGSSFGHSGSSFGGFSGLGGSSGTFEVGSI